jgi:L,D-peptidoglycan transpeptidase YkuD (ErfK/YbiS/YcfS/YnhG family)
MPNSVPNLVVTPDGRLTFGDRSFPCALGKGGCHLQKTEGDGVTPIGIWSLRQVYYRPDRLSLPKTVLPVTALTPNDGWCDDPDHADYNKFVSLPHTASCESLWREDHVYDVIVTLGHNDNPVISGAGSAIFFHVARENFDPTEGCVALAIEALLDVLASIEPGCAIDVRHQIS